MPSRQRGPVFDDVARRPEDPPLIEVSRHIVIRTQDVEISGVDPLDHEVDGLLRRPRPRRLLAAAFGGKAGKDETGDQKMSADAAPPAAFRNSCCSASVKAFTPAFDTL